MRRRSFSAWGLRCTSGTPSVSALLGFQIGGNFGQQLAQLSAGDRLVGILPAADELGRVRETTPGTGCWPPAGPVAPLLRGNRRGDLVGEHDFPSCQ